MFLKISQISQEKFYVWSLFNKVAWLKRYATLLKWDSSTRVWWPMRAKLFLWMILISKVNFTFCSIWILKLIENWTFFQLLFHLKSNLSFISFQFFISKLLRKRFCLISCFKHLIWACGPSVLVPTLCMISFSTFISAVNHWKFCTLKFVYNTWLIEANHI